MCVFSIDIKFKHKTWRLLENIPRKVIVYFNRKCKRFIIDFLNFRYQSEFGFTIPNRHIIVDDLRVRGAAHTQFSDEPLANVAQEEIAKPEKVF